MEKIPENKPESIKTFTYVDNYQDGKVVFQYDAADIAEADKAFEEATGLNLIKSPNIGCKITSKENENKN